MYDFNTLFCRGDKLLPPLSILLKAVNWNGEVDDLPGIYNHIKNSATEIPSHSNSILLEPNKSGEIIWKFSTDVALEAACNVPGHYEAGMISKINSL